MKVNISKQFALKGLLLIVVGANVSFIFSGANPDSKTDLASASETVGSAPTTDPSLAPSSAPLHTSPNAVSVQLPALGNSKAVPVLVRGSNVGKKPAAPAQTKAAGQGPAAPAAPAAPTAKTHDPLSATMNVCGSGLRIVFNETLVGSTYKTVIRVKELVETPDVEARMGTFELTADGSFQENGLLGGANQEAKAEIDRSVNTVAKQKLDEIGRCETAADRTRPGRNKGETRGEEELSPAQKKALLARVASCQIDGRTRRPLPAEEKLKCNIDRISQLGNVDDPNEARARQHVELELDRIVKNELSQALRARLMSKDSDVAAEGESMLDDAIAQIQELGSTFNINSARIDRLVGSLEGLKYGAQTYHAALDLANDEKALRQEVQESRRQYGTIQPDVMQDITEFQTRMNDESLVGPMTQLGQYRRYLSTGDFQTFTAPYTALRTDMMSLMTGNSSLLGNSNLLGNPNFNPSVNNQFLTRPNFNGFVGQPGMQPVMPMQAGPQTSMFFGATRPVGPSPGMYSSVYPANASLTSTFGQPSVSNFGQQGFLGGSPNGFSFQPGVSRTLIH